MNPTITIPTEIGCFHSRFTILQKLGEGTYGNVYKILDKQTQNIVSIKIFNNEDFGGIGVSSTTLREITYLTQLRHKNVIKILGIGTDVNKLCYLMEYCDSCLRTFVDSHQLTIDNVKNIFKQIMEGLFYLHSQNIMHRDIKCENILLKGNIVKLCDFGNARSCYDPNQRNYTPGVFVSRYMAPEIHMMNPIVDNNKWNGKPMEFFIYDEKVDIWACGIVLLEMLDKNVDFLKDKRNLMELEKETNEVEQNEIPSECLRMWYDLDDVDCLTLVSGLLRFYPDLRWTCKTALLSNWLIDVNTNDLDDV